MTELIPYIQGHIEFAPFIIFGLLLLAGFNIPVSEDAMLFIAALLASQDPDHWLRLYAAVYLGVYCSDLICYSLGRFVGPRLLRLKFFASMVKQERIEKIQVYYQRYGVATLILGRFIPFGVRNGLFLTAGLGQMHAFKFAAADLLACTISTTSFFWLYYRYGEKIISIIRHANIGIFIVTLAVVAYLYVRKNKDKQI